VNFGSKESGQVTGHEQAGLRPAVVLTADILNRARNLITVAPLTRTIRSGVGVHIVVEPPDGGVTQRCVVLCDQIRTVSWERFDNRMGTLSPGTLARVERAVQVVLQL
jgi:mRNA interferase MazF